MTPRPQLSMTDDEILTLLRDPLVGVLSTIDAGGWPHSVGIYYLPVGTASDLELHMWTYAKSQKVRNAERQPRASLLAEKGQPYVDLRGVLVRGQATVVRDYDAILDLGLQLYERYFLPLTGVPIDEGPRARIERQSHKRVDLVLKAQRIVSWDHARAGNAGGGP